MSELYVNITHAQHTEGETLRCYCVRNGVCNRHYNFVQTCKYNILNTHTLLTRINKNTQNVMHPVKGTPFNNLTSPWKLLRNNTRRVVDIHRVLPFYSYITRVDNIHRPTLYTSLGWCSPSCQFLDVCRKTLLISIGRHLFANSLPFAVRFLPSEEFQVFENS